MKNLHLEHIEDQMFNEGMVGLRSAVNHLFSLKEMLMGYHDAIEHPLNLSVKFDGAPAIFCGVNPENGLFFVGTKSIFNQDRKLNYAPEDIDRNHPEIGLNERLKICLEYLPELGIKNILQGDMMYIQSDLRTQNINNVEYLTFQPNTLVYAIPKDTALADMIVQSKMGIVFHTSYFGKTMNDLQAKFGFDLWRLRRSKNVWFRDAKIMDLSGVATFTEQETKALNGLFSQMQRLFQQINPLILNKISTSNVYKQHIKTFENYLIKRGSSTSFDKVMALVTWVEDNLNASIIDAKLAKTKTKRQMEKNIVMRFYRESAPQLKLLFDMQELIVKAKMMFLDKLNQLESIGTFIKTANGYRTSSHEGFVIVDRLGQHALKLVNRLEFSKANFDNWKPLKESVLTEKVSDVVYHFTPINSALNMLTQRRFVLTPAIGLEMELDFIPKNKIYYMSLARSKIGYYTLSSGNDGVTFNLNGRYLSNRYQARPVDFFQGATVPGRTRETEDRIFSDTPYIDWPANVSDLVEEAHIFINRKKLTSSYPTTTLQQVRTLVLELKKLGIPYYVYEDKADFVVQNRRKALNILEFLGSFDGIKLKTPLKRRGSIDSMLPWRELYYQDKKEGLSPEAQKILKDLIFPEMREKLKTDIEQSRRNHTIAQKTVKIMNQLNIKTPDELYQFLVRKWNPR